MSQAPRKQKPLSTQSVSVGRYRRLSGIGEPTEFVPARWRGYLEQAARTGDAVEYRHYWELTVLLALRDGLRSGDVFVPGSRRYSDPAAYLLTPHAWAGLRLEFCQLVGKSTDAGAELDKADAELHTALTDLERVLAVGVGPVRLGEDGELIIPADRVGPPHRVPGLLHPCWRQAGPHLLESLGSERSVPAPGSGSSPRQSRAERPSGVRSVRLRLSV